MFHEVKTKCICSMMLILSIMLLAVHDSASQYFFLDDEVKVQDKKGKKKKVDEKVSAIEGKQVLPPSVARNIRAVELSDMKGLIKITWSVSSDYFDEFLISRGHSIIDTKAKAIAAETVQVLQSSATNEILDFVGSSGSFYYVVLSKKMIKENDIRLYEDVNYTSLPVIIEPKDVYYHVQEIDAKTKDNQKVKINWQKCAKTGLVYALYRAMQRLDTVDKIKSAAKIADLSDKGEFTDDAIEVPGVYYYAVTAREPKGEERVYPYPGHNYTVVGVTIKAKDIEKKDLYQILSIEAAREKKGVKVRWTYAGTTGGIYYRIFRSPEFINSHTDLSEDLFISDVEISKKTYFDSNPPGGAYYYGILPYGYIEEKTPIIRGVNITSYTVNVKGGKAPQKIEKKASKKKEEPTIDFVPEYTGGTIDMILHKTFFKGKYDQCVKELKIAIPATDNETEKAKASMFIGRSYIEMGHYKKALDFLLLEDVQKHYPDESLFWQENALRKIK